MASNVLDTLVGDILPHVHIKKIIIEDYNGNDDYEYTITLQMELYQKKDQLLKSSWLSDIDLDLKEEGITSLFDFFKLNIISTQGDVNVSKLRKSNPLTPSARKSIFVHKQSDLADLDYWPAVFGGGELSQGGAKLAHGYKAMAGGDPFAKKWTFPLHLGALAGLTQADYNGSDAVLHGAKIREEVYKGDVYYAIPYEHKFSWTSSLNFSEIPGWTQMPPWDNPTGPAKTKNKKLISQVHLNSTLGRVQAHDLGIAVYTSLELSDALGLPVNSSFKDAVNMEGTVSTEIILKGGKPASTREAFVDTDGREWTGAVHYHGPDNPAGGYQGYMVGLKHRPGVNQPKLAVLNKPNILISDMTDPIQQKVPNEMIVIDKNGNPVVSGKDSTSNIGPAYESVKDILELAGGSLQVQYQKETVKDIYKNAKDNDSEFSKLYVSRDAANNARGVFFIDFKQLLLNNSHYLQYFRPEVRKNPSVLNDILSKTRITDLSIMRRRVSPHIKEKGYKTFSDNTPYEEPIKLLASLKDHDSFKSSSSSYLTNTTALYELGLDTDSSSYTRYFAFSDGDMSSQESGYYQYEVRLDFFDGASAVIKEHLDSMRALKVEIDDYYRLASSSTQMGLGQHEIISKLKGSKKAVSVTTNKFLYKPYYDNNYKKYLPQFSKLAHEQFKKDGSYIWSRATVAMALYFSLFSTKETTIAQRNKASSKILNMMMPGPEVNGSPEEIMLCSRIFSNAIFSLEKILNSKTSKKQNNSSVLQDYVSGTDHLSDLTQKTPAYAVVREEHTFDHPREIFKARSDTSFYADYHSVGSDVLFSNFLGVRTFSKANFTKRCYTELLKFSPLAISPAATHGKDPSLAPLGGAIPRLVSGGKPRLDAPGGVPDTLSNTMFSYLSPSVIQLASNSENSGTFNFRYSTYKPSADAVLQGESPPGLNNILTSNAMNFKFLNSLLLVIANYAKNSEDFKHAEKIDSYVLPSDIGHVLGIPPDASQAGIVQSEAYKSYFSKYNITVHSSARHSKVFGKGLSKEGGAKGEPHVPSIDEWPLKSEYFTDAKVQPKNFLHRLASSGRQGFLRIPSGKVKPYDYSAHLPNVFKFKYVRDDFAAATVPLTFLTNFHDMVLRSPPATPELNGFKFFNFNMIVRVEKLTGHGEMSYDDQWSLVTEADLTGESRLFCRISYYDSSLLGGIELPILDQYFILTSSPGEESMPTMSPAVPFGLDILESITEQLVYFESQNVEKLNDFMTTLEKGGTKILPSKIDLPGSTGPIMENISGTTTASQPSGATTGQTVSAPSQVTQAPTASPPVTGGGGPSGGGGGY